MEGLEELYDLPPLEKARALFERGHAERREGRDAAAHGFYTQSLNLFRGHRDRQGEAAALVELADLALHYNPTEEDSFTRRKTLAEESLSISREIGDKRGIGRALRVLASVMPQEGERLLEESLALAREINDSQAIADSLERLGAHHGLRDRERALALKEEALALYRETGNRSAEAWSLFGLAVSSMSSDPARCRKCAEEALGIYRELGQKKQVAQMLMFLASDVEDEETEIDYHTECRDICHEIDVPIWEASSLRSLADIAEKRGDLARAQGLRVEADEIYPEAPLDPELMREFEQALAAENVDAAEDALKRMAGAKEASERAGT